MPINIIKGISKLLLADRTTPAALPSRPSMMTSFSWPQHVTLRQVGELFVRAREVAGDKLDAAHFHDPKGLGTANVMAALHTGIDFSRLMALHHKVAGWLSGEWLHGSIAKAGLPKPLRTRLNIHDEVTA